MKQKRMILCRSQSEAMVLSRRLSACGIDSRLTRPPHTEKVRACSWGIEIEAEQSDEAETCLKRGKISHDVWCWEDKV